ncbi:Glycine oxidase [Pseudomonas fluorescens]|uniref:Glycine oxidase n=1 Tax=Pseudomonas fluorescens TaxID=294 RepID=A0A5E7VL38_PSEFL|nr:FAD-dependent oxidoreductase [Pseudomonas fluorescens]VVQ23382.1 Glycine oxidase [Pseudomonas fluorescens]
MNQTTHRRIVVVGAGIVGASLAYHLSGKGAQVTLIEAGEIASGVTASSFAWINTTYAGADPIAQLRGAAIEAYHRLETELPDLQIHWSGALSYNASAEHPASATLLTAAEVLAREPNLKNPPPCALYHAGEGALDAVQATHALIAGAQALGAQLLTQTRVTGFKTCNADVTGVETAAGTFDADLIVLAAGTGTQQLAQMLNVALPIDASPAIFIRYKTQPDLVKGIISSPEMEIRQSADGTLLAAEDYLGEAPGNSPPDIARQTAEAIRKALHGEVSIAPQTVAVGFRPMPADGIPVVGYLPGVGGVYVCAMHPGVTLAAIVGRLASEELLGRQSSAALEPCRPERLFQT